MAALHCQQMLSTILWVRSVIQVDEFRLGFVIITHKPEVLCVRSTIPTMAHVTLHRNLRALVSAAEFASRPTWVSGKRE